MLQLFKKTTFLLSLWAMLNLTAYASTVYTADIQNVDKKTAIDFMANELIGQGCNIVSVTDYQLVASEEIDDITGRVLYGSNPETRMTFNFAQVNNVVRVSAQVKLVTSPHTRRERTSVIEMDEIQHMLDRFKDALEQQYAPKANTKSNPEENISSLGFNYTFGLTGNYIYITSVLPDGAAGKAGLQSGDRIAKINDNTITDIKMFNAAMDAPFLQHLKFTIQTTTNEEKIIELDK